MILEVMISVCVLPAGEPLWDVSYVNNSSRPARYITHRGIETVSSLNGSSS